MCMSAKKVPVVSTKKEETEPVAQPTLADAEVTKASAAERNKQAGLAGRDIKTAPRGLGDEAKSKKKTLLGE